MQKFALTLVALSLLAGCGTTAITPLQRDALSASVLKKPAAPPASKLSDKPLHDKALEAYIAKWHGYGAGHEPKSVKLFETADADRVGFHLWDADYGGKPVHFWGVFSKADAAKDAEPRTLGQFPQWSMNSRLPVFAKGPYAQSKSAEQALTEHFKAKTGEPIARLKLTPSDDKTVLKFAAWVDVEDFGVVYYGTIGKTDSKIKLEGQASGAEI
ncbi:MAG: hypothetical protein JWM80_6524 [Cyanobacteria bacterium RYN_339]|nr:hypothetical protein [Cyanobacteria bacterium RYN_339]